MDDWIVFDFIISRFFDVSYCASEAVCLGKDLKEKV